MKVLLDVSKTLLLINGAIVIPCFILVTAMYEQQSTGIGTVNNVSSTFHRDIQDDTPKYRQKLDQLEVDKNQLKAELEASQKAKTVPPVVSPPSSVNQSTTNVSPVSPPKTETVPSRPSVKQTAMAKRTQVFQAQPPLKPSQPSVRRNPVSPPQTSKVAVVQEEEQPLPIPQSNNNVNTASINPIKTESNSSVKELAKTTPQGFVSLDDLNKKHQRQTKTPSHPMVAPQPKTPIDHHITLANDLSVGLIVAHQRNELNHGTGNYKKVQTAILSLRKGSSQTLEEAATRANIDLNTLKWLAQYGQNRPGSFNTPQISMAHPE